MKKTKIVCTIGPASESIEMLEKLMESGMDVARLNFSHGSHEEHEARIKNIRQAAKNTNKKRLLFYLIQKDLKFVQMIWWMVRLNYVKAIKSLSR